MSAVAVAAPRRWRQELGTPVAGLLVAPLVVLLTLAFLVPLGWLFWISISSPHLGLQTYRELLDRSAARHALVNTATIGAAVTVASLLVGGFIAWELRWARSRSYRALLWAMLLLPLWTSVVVRNYAFTVLLQRNGVVNTVLQAGHLTHEPLALLYTKLAVFLAMTHSLIPYAALPLYGVFTLIDRDLVHAARSLGASPLRSFTSVVIPIATPAIVGVGALVFVVASGYYVAPVLLGSPRNAFFATIVDQQVNDLYDIPGAAAAAFLLLAGGTLVLLATLAFIGRRRLLSLLR